MTIDNVEERDNGIQVDEAEGQDNIEFGNTYATLGEGDNTTLESQDPIEFQHTEISIREELDNMIQSNYNNLSKAEQAALKNNLGIGTDLIEDINIFFKEGNINVSSKDIIKALNILHNIIKDDPEKHEQLENIIKEKTIEMSHNVNIKIAKNNGKDAEGNTVGNIDYYSDEQKMLIQLRANVCYGENLNIDGKRGEYLFSFGGKNENQKLTTIYIYRLEIITRQDVITYRHEHNGLSTTDKLLNVGELDSMLSVLSREEQNEVMENFLNGCFFHVRINGMHFEDLIGNECFRRLLVLTIKENTEKNITIEQGIKDRENLLNTLGEDGDEAIIQRIQKEIEILKTRNPVSGEYIYKTMGEYYKSQADELNKTIKGRNDDNVDMEQRQHAIKAAEEILGQFGELTEQLKELPLRELEDKEEYKTKFKNIIEKLATLYNDTNTKKYREWIEKGDFIDLYFIKNISVRFFNYLNQEEQNERGTDFFNFMKKCRDEIEGDINEKSDILDIVCQIEEIDGGITYSGATREEFSSALSNLDVVDLMFGLPQENDRNRSNDEGEDKKETLQYELIVQPFKGYRLQYKTEHGVSNFEGGQWVGDVFKDIKSGKIKVVITPQGELCKYEKHDGDIYLWKFDKKGKLPSEPTKIITGTEIMQASLSMSSALETINTQEFNEAMENFRDQLENLNKLTKLMQNCIDKYNNKDLTDEDEKHLQTDLASISTLILNIPEQDLIKLKTSLENMLGNKTAYYNQYEQLIKERLAQIDKLLEVKNDKEFQNNLSKLGNLKSNDSFWERVEREDVVKIFGTVIVLAAGIIASIPSGGTSVLGAAATTAFLWGTVTKVAVFALATNTIIYTHSQRAQTQRNYEQASVKTFTDRNGNEVRIPGYVDEKDMTALYRYRQGDMTFGDFLLDQTKQYGNVVLDSFIQGITLNMVGNVLKGYAGTVYKLGKNVYQKYDSVKGIYEKILALGMTSKVFIERWKYEKVNDSKIITLDVDNCLDTLIPDNLRDGKKNSDTELAEIFEDITITDIDSDGNMVVEYNPDGGAFKKYKAHFDAMNIEENLDGTTIVRNHGKIIKLKPSKAPASYRKLLPEQKKAIKNIGGVTVNNTTGEVTYKNPEGLEGLRSLGAYMENTGGGEVLISDNGYAKIIIRQFNGSDSVITVQPQFA